MKCLITGKETKDKTNGHYPISRQARTIFPKVVAKHNERIKEAFIEAQKEKGLNDELLAKLAPRVSNKYALELLKLEEPDMMMSLEQVMEEIKGS